MSLDYHWDALTFAGQAKYLSVHGLLSTPPGYMVHLPFFTWVLAINYKLFGESPFLSHLIVAIFSFLGTYFTYLLV
jgi:predicted membrane-bound mannosyltransferase